MPLRPPFDNILQLRNDLNIFLMMTEISAQMGGRGFLPRISYWTFTVPAY
jgi:hypothetical protein